MADGTGIVEDPAVDFVAQSELQAVQAYARREATRHLMLFWPRDEVPRRGLDGVLRHGFGRPIELEPQSEDVARMALEADVERVSQALARRAFVLQTAQPDCGPKLGYLYAIADIIGVRQVRDWDELWQAANAGDWNKACRLLVALQWTAVDRNAIDRRLAAADLIFGLRDA